MTYEELVRDHAGEMIEKLVTDVVTKEKAEIHFEDAGDDQWSYEEDCYNPREFPEVVMAWVEAGGELPDGVDLTVD